MNTESIIIDATAAPAAAAGSAAGSALIPVLLLAVVVIAVCVGLIKNAENKKKKNVGVVKLSGQEKPVKNAVTPDMIDDYCRAAQALEDWESLAPYASTFVLAINLLQTSLGLARCLRLERAKGRNEAWFLDEIGTMFLNAPARLALTASGFAVDKKIPKQMDTPEQRALCQKLTPAQLQAETAKLKNRLAAKKADSLAFDALLAKAGPLLWQLSDQARSGESEKALEMIDKLEKTLVSFGCIPHYYDDPVIAKEEKLRVQFIADSPEAVELPGFYMERNGMPSLIGGCAGTRREQAS